MVDTTIVQCVSKGNSIFWQLANTICLVLGVVAVGVQTHLDHRRRSKQSTIDFWTSISTDNRIFYDYLKDNNLDVSSAESDPKLKEHLARLEKLSTGVNNGIYDFKILDVMCGQYLIEEYAKFENYINSVREKRNALSYYKEFGTLVEKIKKYRKKHSD